MKIVITGATGAIGGALAEAYAAPGIELHLHGRSPKKLQAIVQHCTGKGASVHAHSLDLCDTEAVHVWMNGIVEAGVPDLVIVNAGMNTNVGSDYEGEPWSEVDALIDLNLKATMAIVHAVLPAMRRAGAGQVAMISSLAAYYGLPVTPAYCASKAGVKAYGEALRGWLAPEGVKVNVIMPGYVRSRMCDDMPGPKPFLISAEAAARLIQRGLARNKARISFPFPLNLGTWFLAVLPAAVSQWIVCRIGYRGRPAK